MENADLIIVNALTSPVTTVGVLTLVVISFMKGWIVSAKSIKSYESIIIEWQKAYESANLRSDAYNKAYNDYVKEHNEKLYLLLNALPLLDDEIKQTIEGDNDGKD